jgi:hypothetical protein
MTSVALGVLLIALLIYLITLCRPRHGKYQHPKNRSGVVDVESNQGVSVSKSSKDDSNSIDFRYSEDGYPRPTSFINKYESLATLETHTISIGNTQPPKDNVEFDNSELLSISPRSSLKIKLAPLSIPESPLNHANRGRSIKRSNPFEPGLEETDDAASVYSEASAYPNYSEPSIIPPPVPSIPLHFITTPSTLPKSTDSNAIEITRKPHEEETIIIEPPSLPAPKPSFKSSGDNRDEAEAQTEIYKVAKLLQSRQAKLPNIHNSTSRHLSTVSHIERSGSIKPVFSSSGEQELESYRQRLKQKQASTDPISNPFLSTLPPVYSRQ